MPNNFNDFLRMMDERQWFRMLICFLPGLILGKLAGSQEPGSFLSVVASVILVGGVVSFVMWNRLRAKFQPEQADETEEEVGTSIESAPAAYQNVVPGTFQLADLAELRAMCNEQEPESMQLIAMELMVNPQLTFAEATKAALSRRKILGK